MFNDHGFKHPLVSLLVSGFYVLQKASSCSKADKQTRRMLSQVALELAIHGMEVTVKFARPKIAYHPSREEEMMCQDPNPWAFAKNVCLRFAAEPFQGRLKTCFIRYMFACHIEGYVDT